MKKTIRLNERELHRVIQESVKNVLRESYDDELENILKSLDDLITNNFRNVSDPQTNEIRSTLIEAGRLITKAQYLINKRGIVANVVY